MKNGIIINGIEYRAVRHTWGGVLLENECKKCDLSRQCKPVLPCYLFSKLGTYVTFKKVK